MLHPAFAPGRPASIVVHAEGPVPFDARRIVYSEEDERALEAFAYANGAWFPLFPLPSPITRSLVLHSLIFLAGEQWLRAGTR